MLSNIATLDELMLTKHPSQSTQNTALDKYKNDPVVEINYSKGGLASPPQVAPSAGQFTRKGPFAEVLQKSKCVTNGLPVPKRMVASELSCYSRVKKTSNFN